MKEHLLKYLTDEQLSFNYVSEEDMLNVALFNKRAKQWREENPNLKENMRVKISIKGKLWFITIGVAFDLTIRK